MDLESGVGSNLTDINGHTYEDPMTYDTTQNIGTTNTIGQKSEDTKTKEKKNISNHIGYLENQKVTEESKNNKILHDKGIFICYLTFSCLLMQDFSYFCIIKKGVEKKSHIEPK